MREEQPLLSDVADQSAVTGGGKKDHQPETEISSSYNPDELQQVTFRLPASAVEALRRLAQKDHMSLAQYAAFQMTGVILQERAALKAELDGAVERALKQREGWDGTVMDLERQFQETQKTLDERGIHRRATIASD